MKFFHYNSIIFIAIQDIFSFPLSSLTPKLFKCILLKFKAHGRTSLVAQHLRICLPMEGTRVWSLSLADFTCCRATEPVSTAAEPSCHSYWSQWAPGPTSCNYWACLLQPLKPAHLKPVLHNRRSPRNESPMPCNWRAAPTCRN